jgi:formylglycine-generating enzyme required for sulfatase activity
MNDDRAFRLWQERLRTAMHQWETTDKDDGALLRGSLLSEAEDWQQQRLAELSKEERVFIQLSLALRDKETDEREQRQQRELVLVRQARSRLRWLVTVLGTIALSTTGVIAYPQVLRWRAASLSPMVGISAGSAIIGTDSQDAPEEEKPRWTTNLQTFYLEKYEVSNHQYRLCVWAGACFPPVDPGRFYNSPLDHPVVGVTADQAAAYCHWLGRRLPTELEWERTARGSKGRLWPWGNQAQTPTPQQANIAFRKTPKDTASVDKYPDGVSPEGIFNLVGNVWEWTSSHPQEYKNYDKKQVWDGQPKTLPSKFPLIVRGGGWEKDIKRITRRDAVLRSHTSPSIRIRCAS